jgi:hypothetical protein
VVWGGKSADNDRLCGSKPGPRGPAAWSLFPPVPAWQGRGVAARGLVPGAGGRQASAQVLLWWSRPRPMRLRRLSAAVRFFSQALFLAVPR